MEYEWNIIDAIHVSHVISLSKISVYIRAFVNSPTQLLLHELSCQGQFLRVLRFAPTSLLGKGPFIYTFKIPTHIILQKDKIMY